MTSLAIFPSLEGWEATRDTLKWYSRAVGVVPRAHAEFHPKWWHISLKVVPEGLSTDEMGLPGGGTFHVRVDLARDVVAVETSAGERRELSMTEGLTATQFGDRLLDIVASLGLSGEYARAKFESDEARAYNPAHARAYLQALVPIDRILKKHRASLKGEPGPVQLWPHGFDIAFEWFGTRRVEYEEDGEVTAYPAQINFGFSPGEPNHPAPYFYSNPWPFEADQLLAHDLPSGARWFTEGWQGSLLPYASLVNDPEGEPRLLAYLQAVYEVSAPTLMEDKTTSNSAVQ